MSQEIINKYLTIDQQHVKAMTRNSSLTSKQTLFDILKWWNRISSSKTIADLRGKSSSPETIVYMRIGSYLYKIHADTNKKGVKTFLANKDNPWSIIEGSKGNKNKVTNNLDQTPIEGFYMYTDS